MSQTHDNPRCRSRHTARHAPGEPLLQCVSDEADQLCEALLTPSFIDSSGDKIDLSILDNARAFVRHHGPWSSPLPQLATALRDAARRVQACEDSSSNAIGPSADVVEALRALDRALDAEEQLVQETFLRMKEWFLSAEEHAHAEATLLQLVVGKDLRETRRKLHSLLELTLGESSDVMSDPRELMRSPWRMPDSLAQDVSDLRWDAFTELFQRWAALLAEYLRDPIPFEYVSQSARP